MSWLPTCSKKLIFDYISNFMEQSNLFNNTQFGFRPNDSCIYQLISATDCICCIFDTNLSLKLSGVFLHLIKSGMAVSFTNFKIME